MEWKSLRLLEIRAKPRPASRPLITFGPEDKAFYRHQSSPNETALKLTRSLGYIHIHL